MIAIAQYPVSLPNSLTTVDEFEAWQRTHVKEGSYEFVRGRVIPKPSVSQSEVSMYSFLTRLFVKTSAFNQGDSLAVKLDSYVDRVRKRVPDLTYLTAEQKQAIRTGERVKTLFAIELLSDSESFGPECRPDVTDKIQDYFDAGAQLVWYIAPVSSGYTPTPRLQNQSFTATTSPYRQPHYCPISSFR